MTTLSVQISRRRTPLTGLLVLFGALIIFALAFLLSHHGTPKAPPAKVVDAKIAPGPSATKLTSEFTSGKISALVTPPVKKKPKKPATTSAASSSAATSSAADDSDTPTESDTPAYTPPASSSGSSSSGSSKASSGGGVITIG